MPISKSAQKAMRASENKRSINLRRSRAMKSVMKEIGSLTAQGNKKGAMAKLSEAQKAIDKATKRGLIKKNTAARKKSRLVRSVTQLK